MTTDRPTRRRPAPKRRFNLTTPGICSPLIIGLLLAVIGSAADAPLTTRDGRLQLLLPDGYAEKTPPKPSINLEAVKESEGSTILVISEAQKDYDSLAAYAEIIRKAMMDRLRDPQSDDGEKIELAGHPAIRYEITGISSGGLRMAFLVTIIQTETRFNQVIGSCLRTHFADRKTEFATISGTLKELPPKAEDKPEKK